MDRTVLYDAHRQAGARLVGFAGWEMPVNYPAGILAEHLATRRRCGIFDVSHMGRFEIAGAHAAAFLRRVLTNDAARLDVGVAHYTILADAEGGAMDDAFLYRYEPERFVLVVNAANRAKDWAHLTRHADGVAGVTLRDLSGSSAMIAVQGPDAESMLRPLLSGGWPAARRHACAGLRLGRAWALASRTGYTGEPVSFEVVVPAEEAHGLWAALLAAGAAPVGLGARDTLRLEAALPLHGHEYGRAPDGTTLPVFACPLARFAVCLEADRGDFLGREALAAQAEAARGEGPAAGQPALPRHLVPVRLTGRGIARNGAEVRLGDRAVGVVTSGTMVPYWVFAGDAPSDASRTRALALALVDRDIGAGAAIAAMVRGTPVEGVVVRRFIDNRRGRYAVPVDG